MNILAVITSYKKAHSVQLQQKERCKSGDTDVAFDNTLSSFCHKWLYVTGGDSVALGVKWTFVEITFKDETQ